MVSGEGDVVWVVGARGRRWVCGNRDILLFRPIIHLLDNDRNEIRNRLCWWKIRTRSFAYSQEYKPEFQLRNGSLFIRRNIETGAS